VSEPEAAWADWIWQGHHIRWCRAGDRQAPAAAVLIHGFGASIRHWRHNLPVLAEEVEVFALDLLGFGGSDKPSSQLAGEPATADSVPYCFDLWASQVSDLVCEKVLAAGPRRVHLIGNSIGGVVALNAARLLAERGTPPAQVILIDCAQRALDRKRLREQPPLQQWLRPLVMATVRQRWLIQGLFQLLARPAVVRQVLAQAYPSGGNVDEELVNLLFEPSRDPGAPESFRGFVNLFNDRLAPQLLAELNLPVRMLWGEADPWEPVAEARRWADTYPCVRDLTVLPGLGHCPHDEAPERVNPILVAWLSAPGPR